METLENKTVYKCSYCSRVSLSAGAIKTHEFYCKHNPNRGTPCASCKHLTKIVKERDMPREYCRYCYYSYMEPDTGYTECTKDECYRKWKEVTFVCSKTNKKMYYAYKIRNMRKENKEAILSRCDCAMPKSCDMHTPMIIDDELDF